MLSTHAPSGTFTKNITNNATWTYLARYGNSNEHETGTVDFCQSMDSVEQPGRHSKQQCPPEKGPALIMMSAWVMPMFIVPVTLLKRTGLGDMMADRNREITSSSLMP